MLIPSLLIGTLLCISAISAEGEDHTQQKRGISGGGWVGLQNLNSYGSNQQWDASVQNQLPTLQTAPQLPLSGPVPGGWDAGAGLSLDTSSAKEFPGYASEPASPPKTASEPLIIEKAVEKLVPVPVERIVHKPYPVPVPIPQTIPVAVEQLIPVPVKTPIAIPVHHAFPIPIKHAVPVPVPIPVPVPVHDHYGLGIAGLSGGLGQGRLGQGALGHGNFAQGALGHGNFAQGGIGHSNFAQGGIGHGNFGQDGFGQGGYDQSGFSGFGQGLYDQSSGQGQDINQILWPSQGLAQGSYGNGWNQGWSQDKRKRSKN